MVQPLKRQCKVCKDDLQHSEFDCDKDGKPLRHVCKSCRTNQRNQHDSRTGPIQRNRRLLYHYGISLNQYDQMLKDQNGVCKLCKRKTINFWGDKLAVDHCHKTGKVRGLLCDKCNKGLGQFEDNIEVIEAAAQYLKDSK